MAYLSLAMTLIISSGQHLGQQFADFARRSGESIIAH
jgi:hypothetical protein